MTTNFPNWESRCQSSHYQAYRCKKIIVQTIYPKKETFWNFSSKIPKHMTTNFRDWEGCCHINHYVQKHTSKQKFIQTQSKVSSQIQSHLQIRHSVKHNMQVSNSPSKWLWISTYAIVNPQETDTGRDTDYDALPMSCE